MELLLDILLKVVYAVAVISVMMGITMYSVLAERKVCGWIQGRMGPNRTALPIVASIPVVGPFLRGLGMFQPLADGGKFLFKEEPIPAHVHKIYYHLAPVVAMVPALTTVCVVPFGQWWDNGVVRPLVLADVDIGVLFLLAISSLGVYGIVMAGWAANSKYPFMGSVRASAQMISYELAMGVSLLPVFLLANPAGSASGLTLFGVVQAQQAVTWNVFLMPVSAFIYLVALFAETNRMPFDMPESETDLVGSFHTEYGAFKFGMFFVAEYAHVVVGSAVFTVLFLGGWSFLPVPALASVFPVGWLGTALSIVWFLMKVCSLIFFFIWVRWTLPRFRYDQVMNLGWKVLLPLAVANLIFYALGVALIDLNS